MKRLLLVCLALLALLLRVVPRFEDVFQPGFVNFQEVDAWFHVRVMENLVSHFPWRMKIDPYLGENGMVGVATGPFYDWLCAGIALLVGAGNLPVVAAWYPAVLGALLVPVVFLLGRKVFGEVAGWMGAAVVATLPGHWLAVSSLGFTDHHVMEALLSTGYLLALIWAMEKPDLWRRTLWAGLVLGAYALTFVGAAFFIAIVVAWGALAAMRGAPAGRPLWGSLLVAAVLAVGQWHLLWMLYTLASLVVGAVGIAVMEWWGRWCGGRRGRYWIPLALVAMVGLFLVRSMLGSVLPFLMPAFFGRTGAVAELQALVLDPAGRTSLAPAWQQFGGAFVLALVGLYLLGEQVWKHRLREHLLVWVWGVALLILSLGQLRMTYYFAAAAAVVAGYVVGRVVEGETRTQVRWVVLGLLLLVVFVPNVVRAWAEGQKPRGVSAEWRGAMEWLRTNTEAPFGDEGYYLARYETEPKRVDAYRVMTWWDYGYWVEAIGRRVPVTNPTQTFAREAAEFYLAETEIAALGVARRMKAKYVVANAEMPLRLMPNGEIEGQYLALFTWAGRKPEESLLVVQEKDGAGVFRPRILYRPGYYRSMGARLNGVGVEAVQGRLPVVAHVTLKQDARGRAYHELRELRRYSSEEEALAAESLCRSEGCALVGEDPRVSCVRLESMSGLKLVYDKAAVAGNGVRIYEVLGR